MKYVQLSCSYLSHDPITSSEITRTILMANQFINDSYRLHLSLLASSQASVEVYRSGNAQKFMKRQLKAAESIAENRPILGAATITRQSKFKEVGPLLLTVYGTMLLMSRSYSSALSKC